jgi:hypothetical protein
MNQSVNVMMRVVFLIWQALSVEKSHGEFDGENYR